MQDWLQVMQNNPENRRLAVQALVEEVRPDLSDEALAKAALHAFLKEDRGEKAATGSFPLLYLQTYARFRIICNFLFGGLGSSALASQILDLAIC